MNKQLLDQIDQMLDEEPQTGILAEDEFTLMDYLTRAHERGHRIARRTAQERLTARIMAGQLECRKVSIGGSITNIYRPAR